MKSTWFRVGIGAALFSGGLLTAATSGVAAAVLVPGAPGYSATGACVGGIPEFSITIRNVPADQSSRIGLYLDDGSTQVYDGTAVNPVSQTILWNLSARGVGPGLHFISVTYGQNSTTGVGFPLDADNLNPEAMGSHYYQIELPSCTPGAVGNVVGIARTPSGDGYWQATSDGQVLAFGDAENFGSMSGIFLNHPIVGIAATADGGGYWLVASDGGIFSFGDAHFVGSAGNIRLVKPVVGMTVTPDGGGYYLVASDGGIFTYGDAVFHGSAGAIRLNKPIVGMASDPNTGGYWLVASDGGVFSYLAPYLGSTGNLTLIQPIVAMASANGNGYRMFAADGGVFDFGTSGFHGSAATVSAPVVGAIGTFDDGGYLLVDGNGAVYNFGDAGNFGSDFGASRVT